jgi:IS30 family transposase
MPPTILTYVQAVKRAGRVRVAEEDVDIGRVAAELNDRPRKRLRFRKPVEEIADLLLAA